MSDSEPPWLVGRVSAASGLTVRTLHHWDAIALLSPSAHTDAGHRLYTGDDLFRLYQVLALRGLGLALDAIAACLDSGVEARRLLADHRASVEASIAALGDLRDRLARIEAELAADDAPSGGAVLDAIRAIDASRPQRAEALRRQLDDNQLGAMRDRGAALGPGAQHTLAVEWPELYRRAEALRVAGRPPTDPEVGRLVARMDELSARFNGGDEALSAGVRAAWREDPVAMSGATPAQTAGWSELADYLDQARAGSPR